MLLEQDGGPSASIIVVDARTLRELYDETEITSR